MDYIYRKTEVSKEKLNSYSELLSDVFMDTKKYTPEFLDWQYNQNPSGKVVGYDAYYNDKLVAHYVAIPVEYLYMGQHVIKGLLALNVATDMEHRGKGLFTELAALTYAYGEELGYKFVTGVANQNTTSGYIKRLGFRIVAPLDVHIFCGTSYLNKVDNKYFKEIWGLEKVKWRLKNPEAHYYKNNKCLLSSTHINIINVILSEREEFEAINLPQKKSMIKMTIGLNLKNSNRIFKINLPDKLKPSPLNLIFKALGVFKMDVDSSNTFFELIDFDAY